MKIFPVKAKCLAPVQYHGIQITGGTKTPPFLGDLAFTYALCDAKGLLSNDRIQNEKANYKELQESPFLASVFRPSEGAFQHLPVMVRNTMLSVEDFGTNEGPNVNSGSSMYSNFYAVQPIAMGSVLEGCVFAEDEVDLPPTIRMGNQKQGLLELNVCNSINEVKPFWANLYTLKHVLGYDKVELGKGTLVEEYLHQYRIVKSVSLNDLKTWYAKFFEIKKS